MKITVEITTDEQLKEQAVAMAQTVIAKAFERVKFPPGGIARKIEDADREVKCPECGGLYGAHREDCSGREHLTEVVKLQRVLAARDKELADLSNRYELRLKEISAVHEKYRGDIEKIQGDRTAFARMFVKWLQSNKDYAYNRLHERFEEFLNTLPNAS